MTETQMEYFSKEKGDIMTKKKISEEQKRERNKAKISFLNFMDNVIYTWRRIYVRIKYKDVLFRRLFNNRTVLLELYNALNESNHTDERLLTIYTLEDAIYLSYKNDVSFIVSGTLNLYEHQSTMNPNMPLRGVLYFSRQYEGYIKQNRLDIYSDAKVKIPFPNYVVFYNGATQLKDDVDFLELKLSDLFMKNHDKENEKPALECVAMVYNINYGHNAELMERCAVLKEYSIFVSRVVENAAKGMPNGLAIDTAVEQCIKDGILYDFLSKHKGGGCRYVAYTV